MAKTPDAHKKPGPRAARRKDVRGARRAAPPAEELPQDFSGNVVRVFAVLRENEEPMSAYDILEALLFRDVKMHAQQVYRALDKLTAGGFVHKIEGLNAFVACAAPQKKHASAAFAVCFECGAAREITAVEEPRRMLERLARRGGYETHESVMEVYGRCSECAAGSRR